MDYLRKYDTMAEYEEAGTISAFPFPTVAGIGVDSTVHLVAYKEYEEFPVGWQHEIIQKRMSNELASRIFWYFDSYQVMSWKYLSNTTKIDGLLSIDLCPTYDEMSDGISGKTGDGYVWSINGEHEDIQNIVIRDLRGS